METRVFNNPNLDGDVALCDLPHVETNRGNHVFTELARLESMKSERDCEKTRIKTTTNPADSPDCYYSYCSKVCWCQKWRNLTI